MQGILEYLEKKVIAYNRSSFIESDPISVPHSFTQKEDVEISAFFAATLAWGNRKAILKSLNQLMNWMDNAPFDFIKNAEGKDLDHLLNFKYRTFNGNDCQFFIKSLQNIFLIHGGLEHVFSQAFNETKCVKETIHQFKEVFFSINHPTRTMKHIADPLKGSAAKRINMFLRWMVRFDNRGVDFGIWKNIPMSELMIPLDVHSGTVARKLELLDRKQNDWKAVELLTNKLKEFDPNDPVKYDFALFGVGVNKDL